MRFQKGQSGNPAGRPRGARNKSTVLLQELLEGEAEAITRKVIELAKKGDMTAIKLCMERLAPPRRSAAIACDLPPLADRDDALAALAALVAAVGAGDARRARRPASRVSSISTDGGRRARCIRTRRPRRPMREQEPPVFSACCLQGATGTGCL